VGRLGYPNGLAAAVRAAANLNKRTGKPVIVATQRNPPVHTPSRKIEVSAGTKVWPVVGTIYRSWIGKPTVLTRSVVDASMGLIPIPFVERYPRFASLDYRWHRFNKTIREKGKPKKAHVLGFIYSIDKGIIHD